MASPPEPSTPEAVDRRAGLTIGVVVGIPATVAAGAVMALSRSLFSTTNAALVLMIVVVAVSALGGRAAGVVTALAAALSFDFFHTRPYLSLAIDSRDDVETTILLLIAGLLVGTIASWGRTARRRAGSVESEVRRIHRVAETAVHGADAATVIAVAQDELTQLLRLRACRFESLTAADDVVRPRIGRNGALEGVTGRVYGRLPDGSGGFELPVEGAELPVLLRGQTVGRFVLEPAPGMITSLEQRLVAVSIADQLASVWAPAPEVTRNTERRS